MKKHALPRGREVRWGRHKNGICSIMPYRYDQRVNGSECNHDRLACIRWDEATIEAINVVFNDAAAETMVLQLSS